MATFKKGDIVFAENLFIKLTVVKQHNEDVECNNNGNLETHKDYELTLSERPGITASQVRQGTEKCFVYLKDPQSATNETIGCGKIYDYDDQTWLVDNNDNVFPAQEEITGEYTAYSKEGEIFAMSEDNVIDNEDV